MMVFIPIVCDMTTFVGEILITVIAHLFLLPPTIVIVVYSLLYLVIIDVIYYYMCMPLLLIYALYYYSCVCIDDDGDMQPCVSHYLFGKMAILLLFNNLLLIPDV